MSASDASSLTTICPGVLLSTTSFLGIFCAQALVTLWSWAFYDLVRCIRWRERGRTVFFHGRGWRTGLSLAVGPMPRTLSPSCIFWTAPFATNISGWRCCSCAWASLRRSRSTWLALCPSTVSSTASRGLVRSPCPPSWNELFPRWL